MKSIQENISEILGHIDPDPNRPDLVETPNRVEKSYRELFGGYGRNFANEVEVFDNDQKYTDVILSGPIDYHSTCEHHMLPFFGDAFVAYIPDDKIIGLSKLARAVDIFSRRLQNQERITSQVAHEIESILKPKGVAVLLQGRHMCSVARGVKKKDSVMTTIQFLGDFESDSVLQNRFLKFVELSK